MSARASPNRWRAFRPSLRGGLIVLSGISLILLGSAIYLFILIAQDRQALGESAREDALWAVYQTDRDIGRLVQTIAQALIAGPASGAETDAIRQVYDISYSRAALLDSGDFGLRFADHAALGDRGREVGGGVIALAAQIDALPADGSPVADTVLVPLLRLCQDLHARSGMLLRETNQAMNALRVAHRVELLALHRKLQVNIALLVTGFIGIVVLLNRQMHQIARTGRKLALLGQRNRAIALRARAASDAKSTFLATMSHEIRTPLNGIVGASELLAATPLSSDQTRLLSMIRQSGDLLLEVITDILDFSKLESGAVDFQIDRVALPEVAETLSAVLSGRAERKGIALILDLPAVSLGTDPVRLRQVMVNLVGNAVKFTDRGRVHVSGSIGDDILRIEVADTGIGIPTAALAGLFREFSQVDGSASRRFGGTGLGLAICKRIVTGMGGRIGVHSLEGSGSTFWFELPVHPPILPVVAAVARPVGGTVIAHDPGVDGDTQAAGIAPPQQFGGKVLLVEDNPINSAVAAGLLQRMGVTVTVAETGAIALERVSSGHFDLILMDMQMPVMNGIDATQRLRDLGVVIPIVGLTGNTFASDRAACLRAGMDDFIAKPVTTAKLAKALTAAGLHQPAAADLPVRTPAIDADLFDNVRAAVGDAVLESLLDTLSAEADALPARLSALANDPGGTDALLHGLKGAAATLGLRATAAQVQALRAPGTAVASHARQLETLVRQDIDLARLRLSARPAPDSRDRAA